MTCPKVSVVVCTYNGEKFLSSQLNSLISQTYSNLEILISDDKSADDTVNIARSFQSKDPRIKVHTNGVNLGFNKNFEQAFNLATGDFIAVCDQDDIWIPNKIEDMLPLFKGDTALVYCQSVRFKKEIPDIKKYSRRHLFTGNDVRKLMYVNNIFGHNIIFKKELLQHAMPFPEGVIYDWWLTIIAAIFGSINSTENVYTFHRWHNTNVTLKKKDQKIQTKAAAEARLLTLQRILQIKELKKEHVTFGTKLYKALETLQGKKFSFQLLLFLLLHCDVVLFFKKRIWSKAKVAYRLSFAIE